MTAARLLSLAAAVLATWTHPSLAQTPQTLDWRVVPYVGVAQRSPVGNAWGGTADRQHLFVGIALETSILRLGPARLLYAPNVTPLVRLSHTPDASSTEARQPTAFGAGFAPFGLAIRLPVAARVEVFGAGAVGALWFSRVVPVRDARAFNVTLEWGGGIDVAVARAHALRLGYKFHHVSNVYSAPENPGVDGNVFYAGWTFRRSAPR